jgi:hypothetical protein
MSAITVNSTKLAAMDANLDYGVIADSEALQPSLDDIASVVNTNAGVFNTHETAATLAHPDGSVTNSKLATGIDVAKFGDGSVNNTEFQYINTLSSNAQNQLDSKAPLSHIGSNGLAQHALADATNAGFISAAEKAKLATIITTSMPSFTVPIDTEFSIGNFRLISVSATGALETREY